MMVLGLKTDLDRLDREDHNGKNGICNDRLDREDHSLYRSGLPSGLCGLTGEV